MKYVVKYEKLPAQTTVRGKTKLDRNGDPLCSIQIKQSYEQRQDMIRRMIIVADMYDLCPEVWGGGKYNIGNDPKSYSAEEIFADFRSRLTQWKFQKNHLYKSFVDRHNAMMDVYRDFVLDSGEQQFIDGLELFETKCRITLVENIPLAAQMTAIMNSNPDFEVDG